MSSWFVNIDSDPPWLEYSADDAEKIEKSYAKKAKSFMLNKTYKIDFVTMRQVRRDDPDRWRSIKRGGTADEKPPKGPDEPSDAEADDDADEDEPPAKKPTKAETKPAATKAAPDAPWPIPAPAAAAAPPAAEKPAVTKKKTVTKKEPEPEPDEEEEKPAAAPPAVKVAAPAATAPPAAASSAPASAALQKQVDSLKSQLSDLEGELETSEAKWKAQLDTANKQLADSVKQLEKSQGEIEKVKKSQVQAVKDAVEKEQATSNKTINDLKAQLAKANTEKAALEKRATKAETLANKADSLQTELDHATEMYATLIGAIKPLIAVFGIDAKTPIGKAVAAFERLEKTGKISPATVAAAAGNGGTSKKRSREESPSDVDEEKAASDVDEPQQPPTKKQKAPAPPAVVAPIDSPMEDDDATQPMVAPDARSPAGGGTGTEDQDEEMPESSSSTAVPFLSKPDSLRGNEIKLLTGKQTIALSFAAVPSSTEGQKSILTLLGGRNGTIDLVDISSATSTVTPVPVKLLPGRPGHRFARPSSKTQDGEDYSQTCHVLAMGVVQTKAKGTGKLSDTSYGLFAGEGRLLRSYSMEIAKGSCQLTFKEEHDIGDSSWITAIYVLAPQPDGRGRVAVGVSGRHNGVFMYSFDTSTPANLKVERTFPIRSDEIRGLSQLSDGRLVVAGCSSVVAGDLNEGGSIEIWNLDSVDPNKSRSFLQNDLRVHSSIGLRCNGIQVWQDAASGRDQLLAAYEYCSNGARQLVQYSFDSGKGGMDVGATNIEPKNQPSAAENTFTSIGVAPAQGKVAAMTYGGKLILYDLNGKKKIQTIDAHGDAIEEDSTHTFIHTTKDGAGILLTCGGQRSVKAWL